MKSKSALLVLGGVAIGAIAGYFLAPEKSLKSKKGPVKNLRKSKKVLQEKASKYKAELSGMKETTKPRVPRKATPKFKTPGEASQ